MKKYLTEKDLYKEIIISKNIGKRTPQLEKMIILLATNIIKKKQYNNYQDKEDIKSQMIFKMLKHWKGFDEDRFNNTFAYMTEIAKRAMAEGYNQIHPKDRYSGEYWTIVPMSSIFEEGDWNI